MTAETYGFDVTVTIEYPQGIVALKHTDAVIDDRRSGANVILIFYLDDV